eukprot:4748735-Amphidinium_carterae.1
MPCVGSRAMGALVGALTVLVLNRHEASDFLSTLLADTGYPCKHMSTTLPAAPQPVSLCHDRPSHLIS